MDEETAGIMVTNPNTLGLFEEEIIKIAEIVHAKDGLVYADGANMNAVMGMVSMGDIGVDVLHLNLHKTFSTPHGGGGPGAGPVCVTKATRTVPAGPSCSRRKREVLSFGGFSAICGQIARLLRECGDHDQGVQLHLEPGAGTEKGQSTGGAERSLYQGEAQGIPCDLPYDRPCMHECVFSDKNQAAQKITTLDMVKRLMDYGFHPPTIYFPLVVHGAIMIEPTETESKEDIDLFIEAFKEVVREASENPEQLLSAPHRPKVTRLDEVQAARHPCLTC